VLKDFQCRGSGCVCIQCCAEHLFFITLSAPLKTRKCCFINLHTELLDVLCVSACCEKHEVSVLVAASVAKLRNGTVKLHSCPWCSSNRFANFHSNEMDKLIAVLWFTKRLSLTRTQRKEFTVFICNKCLCYVHTYGKACTEWVGILYRCTHILQMRTHIMQMHAQILQRCAHILHRCMHNL
jgi:hypothetical protein